jgi:hypothetical protein
MSSLLEKLVELAARGQVPAASSGCSEETARLIMGCDAFKAAVARRKKELADGDR